MVGEAPPHRGDSLRPLRAFMQVVRLGSVSRAATVLGLTQPAVSLQLQALARDHGVALLQRSGRRLVPTPAGDALLALAGPLVDSFDGLDRALRARLEAVDGQGLSVAAGRVALRRWLPAAAGRWAAEAPDVALQVQGVGGDDALDRLRRGDVALAVGSWLDAPPDIEVLPVLESPACLVAPPAHPLLAAHAPPTLEDLARHALLVPAGRRSTRRLVDLAFARAGVPLPHLLETRDWATTLDLVALGQGMAISNRLAVGPAGDGRVLARPLPGVLPPRPYGIAVRRGRPLSAHAARFLEVLRDALPAPAGA